MAEKVKLRVEQFSDEASNEILYQGPVNIYTTVDSVDQLKLLPEDSSFPQLETDPNSLDVVSTPSVVVFVKNVNEPSFEDERSRGAYFRYDYRTFSWQEISLGSHSHENKEVLDKIGKGDIGNWTNITKYPSVLVQDLSVSDEIYDTVKGELHTYNGIDWISPVETPEEDIDESVTKRMIGNGFLLVDSSMDKLFMFTLGEFKELTFENFPNSTVEFSVIGATESFPLEPNTSDLIFNAASNELFVFSGSKVGDRKMIVMEVTDPDDTDLTYSFDLGWTDLPQTLPVVDESDEDKDGLFLGLDSAGNAMWKNTFVPSQTFQFEQVQIIPSSGVIPLTRYEQIKEGRETIGYVSLDEVKLNESMDEVLLMVDSMFVPRDEYFIDYRPTSNVLRIILNGSDDVETIDGEVTIIDPINYWVKPVDSTYELYKYINKEWVRIDDAFFTAGTSATPDDNFYWFNTSTNVLHESEFEESVWVFTPIESINQVDEPITAEMQDARLFEENNTVSVLIIRNGAAAVLDELADEYITKADAINLLSGGSVNLRKYATKTDLQSRAMRDHTHSQFARIDHNHDYRYANVNHTHSEYLTRDKTLQLIQEYFQEDTEVMDILTQVSQFINDTSNTSTLTDLLALSNNVSTIETQIETINDELDSLFDPQGTDSLGDRFASYLRNKVRLITDQIDTEFVDDNHITKNLTQVLRELREDIDQDLNVLDANNIELPDIEVQLGEGQSVGNYETGKSLLNDYSVSNLEQFLEKLLVKIIPYNYVQPELEVNFSIEGGQPVRFIDYPEIGEAVTLRVIPTFLKNDAGNLRFYRLFSIEEDLPEDTDELDIIDYSERNILLENTTNSNFIDNDFQFGNSPVTLYSFGLYQAGPLEDNNVGDPTYEGRIEAGRTELVSKRYEPKRALFYGALDDGLTVADFVADPSLARDADKTTLENYDDFSIEVTMPEGKRTIFFALPLSEGELSEIYYNSQPDINFITSFEDSGELNDSIVVPAANSFAGVPYRLYLFKQPHPSRSVKVLRFVKHPD